MNSQGIYCGACGAPAGERFDATNTCDYCGVRFALPKPQQSPRATAPPPPAAAPIPAARPNLDHTEERLFKQGRRFDAMSRYIHRTGLEPDAARPAFDVYAKMWLLREPRSGLLRSFGIRLLIPFGVAVPLAALGWLFAHYRRPSWPIGLASGGHYLLVMAGIAFLLGVVWLVFVAEGHLARAAALRGTIAGTARVTDAGFLVQLGHGDAARDLYILTVEIVDAEGGALTGSAFASLRSDVRQTADWRGRTLDVQYRPGRADSIIVSESWQERERQEHGLPERG